MTETAIQAHESGALGSERIRRILQQNGLEVAGERWALLERWAELLRDHNQRINLVSRKEEGLIWEKHLLPCL
ncbi:MAG: class I SAM-dependent methyltransferase, partial [SAR324 cluster bacterium]|nr:class I SAM-dependent methyltransferase [SAR324 cluster bacterium]